MSDSIFKHAFSTSWVMIAFTAVFTVVLAFVYETTREPIAKSEADARMALFRQILPDAMHDNDLLKDTLKIAAGGDLGNHEPTLAYRARLLGKPSAVILEAIAPDGYKGDIKLLIAVSAGGELVGVRVLAHNETPGLGDYIDIQHGDWIKKSFDGQSLTKTPDEQWKVKKDGGSFDYMAGATITPRAVVKAVHLALRYFAAHQDEIFATVGVKQ